MELGPGEPAAGPWRVEPIAVFARALADRAGTPHGRPRLIAVDGRGGSGKTALAGRLGRVLEAAVVHSDHVAWGHSRFGWDDLMADGVLAPLRAGRPVHYRPPGWDRDAPPGRAGPDSHLDVVPGETVIVEGVGAGRRSLAGLVDVVVWVQSDLRAARRRGLLRDVAEGRPADDAARNWDEWEAEEVPFLLGDRPWERADLIVGTDAVPHDAETEVVVATNPRAGSAG
jgi:hypothetical protein